MFLNAFGQAITFPYHGKTLNLLEQASFGKMHVLSKDFISLIISSIINLI
jgi:hypothetical protein